MTIIYKHEAPKTDRYDTQHIVVERLYDGSTDITIIVAECGNPAAFMNHNLLIAESDKMGAAICKDIIDNYKRHAAHLKDRISDLEDDEREIRYRNTRLENIMSNHDKVHASIVAGLQLQLGDLRDIVRERNHAINNTVIEHNIHSEQLYTKIEELEARNKALEDEVGNLRVINTIHCRRNNQ